MKYMIVLYDRESRTWGILHYSHDYEDMIYQYEKCMKQYPGCQVLVDMFDLQATETKKQLYELQKEMKEFRAKYKLDEREQILTGEEE